MSIRPRRAAIALALALCAAGGPAVAALGSQAAATRARVKLTDYFSKEDIDRSKRYNGPRYALGFASLGLGLVALGVLGLGATTRALGRWAGSVTGGRWPLIALLLSAAVVVVPAILTLPFDMARNLSHERAWHFSTQTLGGYLADWAKGNLVQIVITAAATLGFFGIIRLLPRAWPAAAAAFMVALTVGLVVVYPLVYEPLFNKFRPVDSETSARIVAIAEKVGVKVDKVLVADASRRTTKQNAYVSGLGATKRVVLYDTLLQKSTPRQVDLIVAHELGHVVHKDVFRGTALGAIGAAAGVMLVWFLLSKQSVLSFIGASGPGDPRSLPFLVVVIAVASLVTMPLMNGFSRHIEGAADRFAVQLTHDKEAAVDVEVSLAKDNLSDVQPNPVIEWIFFSHPAPLERIQIALESG